MSHTSSPVVDRNWNLFGLDSNEPLPIRHQVPQELTSYLLPIQQAHISRMDVVEKMLAAYLNEELGIWIHGPTGCGKSEEVRHFLAAMGIPAITITGDSSLRRHHLIGRFVVKDGSTIWVPGKLVRAMSSNCILLFEEMDACDPEELLVLHEVMDTRRLMIDETGEIVTAGPNFGVIVTANTSGDGDETGNHAGVKTQNKATRRRFKSIAMTYLEKEQERKIILPMFSDMLPDIQTLYIESFLNMAQKSRNLYLSGASSFVIDTGMLASWVKYSLSFGMDGTNLSSDRAAIHKALHFVGLDYVDKNEMVAYESEFIMEFGTDKA